MGIFTNTQVSLFTPTYVDGQYILGTSPQIVLLSDVLFRPLQQDLIHSIRSEPNKHMRKAFKRGLYAITPSAICEGGRKGNNVIRHTKLMAFDIDGILGDVSTYFQAVRQIPYVLYLGRSASGNGLWGLIQIACPEKHGQHFEAMRIMFNGIGITVDTAPKAVNSLRFVVYDESAYYNENAELFRGLVEQTHATVMAEPIRRLSITYRTVSEDLLNWFNRNCTVYDMHEILTNAEFHFYSHSGEKHRYTRPGKDTRAGLSIDYHESRRTLFSFSSNVPMISKWKQEVNGWSCSPVTALLLYGCGGFERNHWKMAFDYIRSKQA